MTDPSAGKHAAPDAAHRSAAERAAAASGAEPQPSTPPAEQSSPPPAQLAAGSPEPDEPAEQDEARLEREELAAEIEMFSAERVIFFTDAVSAIAMTLLAFDLPLPHVRHGQSPTNLNLLAAAARDSGSYLVFLISFVVIGNYWRLHHRVFRYVASISNRVAGLNMFWLLLIIVVPFATRVLSLDNGAFQVRFSFYAAVQVLIAVTTWALIRMLNTDGLLRSQAPDAYRGDPRLLVMAGIFAISIPLSFVPSVGRLAYACWVAGPFATVLAKRLHERRTGLRLPD